MKRILTLALIVVAMLALAAAPALAEGYNVDPDGDGVQGYYTRANGYEAGPHGGYNSTTNKCQECHSTHYATGSYMLLRANTREAACDFCHVGGGGSSINIQMDNAYDANGVISEDGEGMGTGHTLGYTGNAPVDINPAYSDANGFACFDCHTPHGNSARVLTTFANPGRAFEPNTNVVAVMAGPTNDVSALFAAAYPAAVNADGTYNIGIATDIDWNGDATNDTVWGITKTEGNIVLQKADTKGAMKKPIWPTGRFLLLKNPDDGDGDDEAVIAFGEVAGSAGLEGVNKLAIDWEDPYGPADSGYGGDQNLDYDKVLPWNPASDPTGMLAVSEFCTDCHDGAAGASTQAAVVQVEHGGDNYATAYSHDVQPRH